MVPIDLSKRLAVVTGASGQLGRVISKTLAQAGADLALSYHKDKAGAEKVRDGIRALGVRCEAFQADVTDLASILKMKDAIGAALGAPDIIVNNAVAQYPWKSVLEQPAEDYESQFRTCVLHNVFMAKAFVPGMIEKKWGRVIATNTECAMQNFPGQSAYVSGKRGMDGVIRILAKEIGEHQITVNEVAPGWMISDRDRQNKSEKQEGYDKNVPLKHRGTDQDVANAVCFLASDLAGFISGVYLPVCGGNVMPTI